MSSSSNTTVTTTDQFVQMKLAPEEKARLLDILLPPADKEALFISKNDQNQYLVGYDRVNKKTGRKYRYINRDSFVIDGDKLYPVEFASAFETAKFVFPDGSKWVVSVNISIQELRENPNLLFGNFVNVSENINQRISEILGLPYIPKRSWKVKHALGNRIHLAYNKNADMSVYGHIRAMTIDINVGAIICKSGFRFTPRIVSNNMVEENGIIKIGDLQLPREQISINKVSEGAVVVVTYWQGEIQISSHSSITCRNSHWGKSGKFRDIFLEIGPKVDQLFDIKYDYNCWAHTFMICDPNLIKASRQKVEAPYIVYLKSFRLWDKSPYPAELSYDGENYLKTFVSEDNPDDPNLVKMVPKLYSRIHRPYIAIKSDISVDEANNFLNFGFYKAHDIPDYRLSPGEAVIIHDHRDGNSYRIESIGFNWRENMRGNESNPKYLFYRMVPESYMPFGPEQFKKYVPLPQISYDKLSRSLQESGMITVGCRKHDMIDLKNLTTAEERLYCIWLNYLIIMPPFHQPMAINMLRNFIEDRNLLIQKLITYEKRFKGERIDQVKLAPSFVKLIKSARVKSSEKKETRVYPAGIIKGFIYNEKMPDLYGLVREIKRV